MFTEHGSDEYMALIEMPFLVQGSYPVTENEYFRNLASQLALFQLGFISMAFY